MKIKTGKTCLCKNCGKQVLEISRRCKYCGISSPSINSKCPLCGKNDFEWSNSGFNIVGAIMGGYLLGFFGAAAGSAKSGAIRCICNNCGNSWHPRG